MKNTHVIALPDHDVLGICGGAVKVDICHYDDEGNFVKILSVSANALKGHGNHGDSGVPMTGCPETPGGT